MREAKFVPTMKSHMLLLSAYARAGRVLEAEALVEDMENTGLQPDTFVFNSLLSAYGNSGRCETPILTSPLPILCTCQMSCPSLQKWLLKLLLCLWMVATSPVLT